MARLSRLLVVAIFAILVSGCAAGGGGSALETGDAALVATEPAIGIASYYGREFRGRATASGMRYDDRRMTAAHPTLPFGTRVRVTNLANDRSVIVTINDRGPFRRGRIIDVSRGAARRLGFLGAGTTRVRLEPIGS